MQCKPTQQNCTTCVKMGYEYSKMYMCIYKSDELISLIKGYIFRKRGNLQDRKNIHFHEVFENAATILCLNYTLQGQTLYICYCVHA